MTPLVLLPGMMCDARLFAPQVAALGAERDVAVLPVDAHDTVEALARTVLAAAPPRFALAGLSMGGIVAMAVLAEAPRRIERLALMDTSPLAEAEEAKRRRDGQIARIRRGELRAVMRDEMKPNYVSGGPRKPAILDLCMAMAEDLGAEAFVRQSLALQRRPDRQATLRRIEAPTLVLCGEHDIPCPLERHELMHSLIPRSELTVVAGAGHLTTLERPDAVTEALRQWLNR